MNVPALSLSGVLYHSQKMVRPSLVTHSLAPLAPVSPLAVRSRTLSTYALALGGTNVS